jgi:hypothetical protein
MPKGWKENPEQKRLEEARRIEIAKHGAKKAAEIEAQEKQKWIEIERNLKQMKKEGKWLDYYDFQKLKEAEIRRKTNNYSPEPIYVSSSKTKYSSSGSSSSSGRYRTRDAAGIIGIIFLILGFVLIFAVVIFANPVTWGMNVVYVLVLGVIFGVTGYGILQATGSSNNNHGISDMGAYFAARGGSARAKWNIMRGHWYSRRR